MARTANRFTKGTGAYSCSCCGRITRDTGRGDCELVKMCGECYDLAGEENHLSDNGGKFYDSPANVLGMIAAIAAKGGVTGQWDTLKAQAQAALAAATKPAPRIPYTTDANLANVFQLHALGGPRAVWFAQYGNGDKPTTPQVEDAVIEFYTAYNARFPGTF